MRESLDEPASVLFYYDAKQRHVQPHVVLWRGRHYKLGKVDFWHKTRHGDVLVHHFSLSDTAQTVYFKLALNSTTLHWTIEEYMSGDQMKVVYGSE